MFALEPCAGRAAPPPPTFLGRRRRRFLWIGAPPPPPPIIPRRAADATPICLIVLLHFSCFLHDFAINCLLKWVTEVDIDRHTARQTETDRHRPTETERRRQIHRQAGRQQAESKQIMGWMDR